MSLSDLECRLGTAPTQQQYIVGVILRALSLYIYMHTHIGYYPTVARWGQCPSCRASDSQQVGLLHKGIHGGSLSP